MILKTRRILKHDIPLEKWSCEQWGWFYKELILCKSRIKEDEPLDQYTAKLMIADMYFKYPNYSELSRVTNIPRSKISKYVKWVLQKFTI